MTAALALHELHLHK